MRHAVPLFVAAIAIALAAQPVLAFRINANWDEFVFLARVHEYLRGEPVARFQTLYVHLFAWLPGLGGSEIDQIVAGRLAMAACLAGSALLVYAIARRFAGREAALFGLLAYLSLTVVAQHGASFRADPLATLLSLLAIWLLLSVPNRIAGAAFAGLAMAFALLVTVKSVFYLAAIGAALFCLAAGLRGFVRLALCFGIPFLTATALLYLLHDATLAPAAAGTLAGAAAPASGGAIDAAWRFAGRIAGKMFVEDGIFPRWREFLVLVTLNPLFWFMAVDGALATARRRARADWLPLALAVTLLTPILYRNAFFYFFAFILPPAAILIAISYDRHRERLRDRNGRASRVLAAGVVLALLAFLAINYARLLPDRLAPQRQTIATVHQVFPQPVRYIDGFRAVASFPHAGFFMSSWGMDRYRAAGEPVFAALVADAQPPMLLADSPSLYAALVPGFATPAERLLLAEDAQFLSDHYQQYWGMLFVAGKRFAVPAGGARDGFTIAVAGDYRLEGTLPVRIDGREFMPGEIVSLAVGEHAFEADAPAGGTETVLRLLWAAAGPAPEAPPVDLLSFFAIVQKGP
jgi:hypothetical protein